jgi:hypothetical protein
MQFPSTDWFEALRAEAAKDEETFRRLGFCDAAVRVDVRDGADTRSFLLTFRDYGCTAVRELDGGGAADFDFALVADHDVWREMIENIRANGRADLEHTLNYLQLPGTLELVAEDQGRKDMFYRFNQTFQEFFNRAAAVPTEFAAPAATAG